MASLVTFASIIDLRSRRRSFLAIRGFDLLDGKFEAKCGRVEGDSFFFGGFVGLDGFGELHPFAAFTNLLQRGRATPGRCLLQLESLDESLFARRRRRVDGLTFG
ncbi:MAG: hypothetical protein M3Y24_05290 [Acidobacteriota bacterium]|nr:hypothetical protein [Acidobacteriota bacterium]